MNENRTEIVHFRVSPDERAAINRMAAAMRRKPSDAARLIVLKAVEVTTQAKTNGNDPTTAIMEAIEKLRYDPPN